MLLKVSPRKGVICFRKRGKLRSWYIGPFRVIAMVGRVTYLLDLTIDLGHVHNNFLVSQLCKCVLDGEAVVPLDVIQFDERLNYIEWSMTILE